MEELNIFDGIDEFDSQNDINQLEELYEDGLNEELNNALDADINDVNASFNTMPAQKWEEDEFGRVTVTDIFGQKHHYDSMDQAMRLTDMLSGMPCSCFSSMPYIPLNSNTDLVSPTRDLLDKSNEINSAMSHAVDKYNEAKAMGDFEEMAKWRDEANRQQQNLYDLFGKSTYGLPAKAPGID